MPQARTAIRPPSYARVELEELAGSYSLTTGIPPFQRGFAHFATFLVAAAVFGGLSVPRPWVPAEHITLKDGSAQTGYILGTDNDRLTVLWATTRKVELIEPDNVVSRTICQETGGYRTLLQVLGDSAIKTANYAHCD